MEFFVECIETVVVRPLKEAASFRTRHQSDENVNGTKSVTDYKKDVLAKVLSFVQLVPSLVYILCYACFPE